MTQTSPKSKKTKVAKSTPPAAYLVLVFGVAVFIGVAVLVAQRFITVPASDPAAQQATQTTAPVGPLEVVAPKKPEMPNLPERDIAEKDVQGNWIAKFLDYTALFQVRNGAFQILVSRDDPAAPVYYSRGTYTLNKATMTLVPNASLGAPEANTQTQYLPLAGRAFDVIMMLDKDMMVWRPGKPDPNYPNRNATHPLIQYSSQEFLVFDRDAAAPAAPVAPAAP
ncbi:hypothetical protein [Micavibrio aeruginosavorus]|uniref:Uncharacterized protein n=1 Tax=Micavibrio aeruginosavorus EPB TaxID=349215 RepID=M4VGL0_9BACT|nr:hypothetical protein [Micavibrio aeruginosavorus]AGH97191.1 hypothetical protein A11S_356 [Micavibrio aeruginosavorus EPB]